MNLSTQNNSQIPELRNPQKEEERERERGQTKFKLSQNKDSDLREYDCFISEIYQVWFFIHERLTQTMLLITSYADLNSRKLRNNLNYYRCLRLRMKAEKIGSLGAVILLFVELLHNP